jgi:hypothetical protein
VWAMAVRVLTGSEVVEMEEARVVVTRVEAERAVAVAVSACFCEREARRSLCASDCEARRSLCASDCSSRALAARLARLALLRALRLSRHGDLGKGFSGVKPL